MNAGEEKKVKILFAIGRFSVGGAEKLLVRQINALDKKRFAPSLITLFDEQKDTFANRVRIDECFRFRFILDVPAFLRLYRYLRRKNFDVVVTSLFSANFLVRVAAIFARVPTIISYEHNIYPNKHGWQIFMDWLLAKRTARIIVDSEAARAFTARQEGIALEKFVTLFIPPLLEQRPPMDAAALRTRLAIPLRAPVVLTVSRLVSDKGHTHLIEAAKNVLARFPDAYFLIVGWGPLQDDLKKQAESLGISSHVLLLGRMDIQDVLPLADVYVDSSISTDLPVAIMEAMREGKAIVATSVGDVPVFIQNQKTGILVEPKNPASLAAGIEMLLTDAALRAKLGEGAKKKVQEYSLDAYMKAFEGLIHSLVA
ncbi:MAG: glycosyltransferase [bacterium]|nr:glycosyltransferase [bacterium]